MPEREGSTVAFFRQAGPGDRVDALDRKLEDLQLSATTAMNQVGQILDQLESPRKMVAILAAEVATDAAQARLASEGRAARCVELETGVREALAYLAAIERDGSAEDTGHLVDRAMERLGDLL